MPRTVETVAAKLQMLTEEQLAEIDGFLAKLQQPSAAARLSEPSFAAVWNNPEDAAYDEL